MRQIFLCVLSLSLSGALAGLLILLIRPVTRRVFSKRWNYYIWLLVAVRLMIPVYLENAYSVTLSENLVAESWRKMPGENAVKEQEIESGSVAAGQAAVEAEAGQQVAAQPVAPEESYLENGDNGLEPVPIKEAGGMEQKDGVVRENEMEMHKTGKLPAGIGSIFGAIWLLGAGISLMLKIRNYQRFTRHITKSWERVFDRQVQQAAEHLCVRLAMKKEPEIYESGEVPGPITVGLFRPVIVLPKEKERSLPVLSLVLHHEFVHVKRKDLWYKWLYQVLLSLHWFNPILYLVERKMNRDCELSCDEAVLAALTQEGKRAYGNVLLDAAERNMFFKGRAPFPTLFSGKEDLKVRLKGILQYKKQNGFKIIVSLCLSAGMVFLSACGSVRVSPDAMPFYISEDAAAENGWDSYERSAAGEYSSFWDSATDEYTSFWDSAANEYTSFWDRAVFAVGNWIDGSLDDFLSKTVIEDKSGEAWRVYDDDTLLAGEDIRSQWHMYVYHGGLKIKCNGMYLNGDASVLIAYAKDDGDYQVHSAFEGVDGRFKIVHIGPDGEVNVINETGEENWVNVSFKAGRNVIKLVGQGAKIRDLKVEYSSIHERDFESIYYSQEEEQSDALAAEIKLGIADKDKVMRMLQYLDEETVSEAFALFLSQQVPLSEEEMVNILIYSDSELAADYLVRALEDGDIKPLSDEMITRICPYLDGGALKELLVSMSSKVTGKTVYQCAPYLDSDELKEILISMGDGLTGTLIYQCAPYLDSSELKEALLAMEDGLLGETVYQCAPYMEKDELAEVLLAMNESLTAETVYCCAPYLGENGLREVLLSMGSGMNFELLYQCAPYLGNSNLEKCMKKYLEDGNEMTYSQYSQILPYLGEKAIERLEKVKPPKPLAG